MKFWRAFFETMLDYILYILDIGRAKAPPHFDFFGPNFDPRWASIFDFLARFGPFWSVSSPDSDSGPSNLPMDGVRPQ